MDLGPSLSLAYSPSSPQHLETLGLIKSLNCFSSSSSSFSSPLISKLRDFHQSLEKELDEEGHDGAFYDVIVKNKSNFLQYCHVVVQTQNLNEKIWRKDASEMRKQLEIVKPAIALRNQPPGSFFLSAMDVTSTILVHC